MTSYDLLVIGAGSGGVRASRIAAQLGARVAVVEQGPLGGTCVNAGCVPKKLLAYAAELGDAMEDAAGFGWRIGVRGHDWGRMIEAKDRELARLNGVYAGMLEANGVQLFRGHAHFVDRHHVKVGEQLLRAEHVLVATGSRPRIPEFRGADRALVSHQALALPEMPRRMAILGGGYIAVEFAGIFNALGADVHLVYRGPLFLRGFDDDVRSTLAAEMGKRGVAFHWSSLAVALDEVAGARRLTLSTGRTLEVDHVLLATGRVPNTTDLGLEEIGVELGPRGGVVVDDEYRSTVPHIFAVGDCIDRVMLTPVALAEGTVVARQLFGERGGVIDYELIPTAVFSQPNVAAVGLTEHQACSRFPKVRIYRSRFRPLQHSMSGRDEKSMMKIVVDDVTDRVVGVHIVGPDAGEIVQGFAVAMTAGATKADFDRTLAIHPTSAEELVTMRKAVDG